MTAKESDDWLVSNKERCRTKQVKQGPSREKTFCIMTSNTLASYFPEARNSNSSNADTCSDVAGPSSSGSGDLFCLTLDLALDPALYYFPNYRPPSWI